MVYMSTGSVHDYMYMFVRSVQIYMYCTLTMYERSVLLELTFHTSLTSYKQGTFPTRLEMNSNDLVCTDGGSLLRDLFRMSQPHDVPRSFVSSECEIALNRCESCFQRAGCSGAGLRAKRRFITSNVETSFYCDLFLLLLCF